MIPTGCFILGWGAPHEREPQDRRALSRLSRCRSRKTLCPLLQSGDEAPATAGGRRALAWRRGGGNVAAAGSCARWSFRQRAGLWRRLCTFARWRHARVHPHRPAGCDARDDWLVVWLAWRW